MDTKNEVIRLGYDIVNYDFSAGSPQGLRRWAASVSACQRRRLGAWQLEVGGQPDEHEPAEGVVDLRIGAAVAEAGRTVGGARDRRVLVEHVVHADPEVEVVVDREVRRQVQVA